jgi:hypothetical protein
VTADDYTRAIVLAHAGATLFMTGLIWFVQVVHYPLFAAAAGPRFDAYARRHAQRTTWVVGPPMLAELATAVLLVWLRPAAVPAWQPWAGLALLAVVWASTAFVQVPCHAALAAGFDGRAHRRLTASNWVRTTAWSLRSIGVLWTLGPLLR